jgi:hypothetical protein
LDNEVTKEQSVADSLFVRCFVVKNSTSESGAEAHALQTLARFSKVAQLSTASA